MITASSVFKFLRNYASIIILSILAIILISCQLESFLPQASATPTPSKLPTFTPAALANTPLAPPTAPVVVTVPPTPAPIVATATENVRVRSTPSTSGAVLTTLTKGTAAQAVGRTAAADWVQILVPTNPNERGWVSAQFVSLSGPIQALAVVGASTNPPVATKAPAGPTQPPVRTPTRRPYPYP